VDQLKKGDILLGDRACGEYTTLAQLPQRGVDVVARLHQRRQVDFRKARRLGHNDGLLVWTKGYQQSAILSATEWALLPAQITVRILRFAATIRGFRARRVTLVTTLLDPNLFPAQDLIDLYAQRWRLELCLRDLKTTMDMEQLRCKTPAMAEKDLLAYLVAHNLIRCVMAQAVARYAVDLERVSFKGSVDALANTATRSPKRPTAKCAANSGRTSYSTWPATWSATGPTVWNRGPSSVGPSPILCSTSLDAGSRKSPIATATGKAVPAIIETLTKGHSGRRP
jgi:hypothetical protein